MNHNIRVGQRYTYKDSHEYWTVVQLLDDKVGLSGPGPCRSLTYATVQEMESDWNFVNPTPGLVFE